MESKIQLRARILQEISKLRSLAAVCDKDIEACISNLSEINDKTFLCSTILKEIDGSIVYFDGVLAILAINLAPDVLEKCIFTFLENPRTSEEKKLFLINLLNQAGIKIDQNLIHLYVKDADEIINIETEKFLQMAEINPEAQIDFLDFYFGIAEADRNILLESIIKDYTGDMLANILSPLIYSIKDKNTLLICMDGLLKSRSYLAYSPLERLIQTLSDEKIISCAKKIKNELKIAGLRKEISILDYFKNLFKDSKPLEFWVSPIDGNSNFSVVFAREYQNGTVSTFFTVINLECGPVSCFGLSNILKNEYENVLSRLFKDTDKIPLDLSVGKALIDKFADFGANIPYEFFAWRQLTYDIEPMQEDLLQHIKATLSGHKLNDADISRAINSEYGEKWFFEYSAHVPDFTGLIDEICKLKEEDFEKFDICTAEFVQKTKESGVLNLLRERFLYQAYFLKCLKFKNLSSLFYSIYLDNNALFRFYELSIQKSVYEFFLRLEASKKEANKANIFMANRKIKHFDFDSKKMLKLIEAKWAK